MPPGGTTEGHAATPDPASVPDADFDVALREVLTTNAELYATVLAEHLGRHVAPFAVTG